MKVLTAYEFFQGCVERIKHDHQGLNYTLAEEVTLRYMEDAAAALLLLDKDEDGKVIDALPLTDQIAYFEKKRDAMQEEVWKLNIVIDSLIIDREERRKQVD